MPRNVPVERYTIFGGSFKKKLTEAFNYNIPQRWSIAHLYQAILNKEPHCKDIAFFTTLAGYVHWQLTGSKVLGVGDASGMYPIDIKTGDFDETMIKKFDELVERYTIFGGSFKPERSGT